MATSNRTAAHRPRRVAAGPAALVLACAAIMVLAGWLVPPLKSRAEAGAAFGARIGCSCRFVAGRRLSECTRDFEPGMALVRLSEDPAAKSVTASVPLLASDTARLVPGSGCRLDPWVR